MQSWHVGKWKKKPSQEFPTQSNAAAVLGTAQLDGKFFCGSCTGDCTDLPRVGNFIIFPRVSRLIWSRLKLRSSLVRFRIKWFSVWGLQGQVGLGSKKFARSYCNLTINRRLRSLISPTLWGEMKPTNTASLSSTFCKGAAQWFVLLHAAWRIKRNCMPFSV